ncbi:MAG: enoyl-CoA hydratase/isomerase family protein, partial [Bacteroidetes bacterium]|nr:enoyl-CoA hydratase/isomerase family protein [Bacteroidota bacterium]
GGCVMVLGCDYRVMAEGDFSIGLNEVPFGIVVPDTIFNLYSFVVGKQAAYKYLLEGKLLSSSEALSAGLVDELAPLGEVLEKAEKQMKKYLSLPQGVWVQSKLNFRAGLLQTLNTDNNPSFEQTVKYWWSTETRNRMKAIIESLGKK